MAYQCACVSLAGERLGERVGYAIGRDSCLGPATRVTFVTVGILLRRLVSGALGLRPGGGGGGEQWGSSAAPLFLVLDEIHEMGMEQGGQQSQGGGGVVAPSPAARSL